MLYAALCYYRGEKFSYWCTQHTFWPNFYEYITVAGNINVHLVFDCILSSLNKLYPTILLQTQNYVSSMEFPFFSHLLAFVSNIVVCKPFFLTCYDIFKKWLVSAMPLLLQLVPQEENYLWLNLISKIHDFQNWHFVMRWLRRKMKIEVFAVFGIFAGRINKVICIISVSLVFQAMTTISLS